MTVKFINMPTPDPAVASYEVTLNAGEESSVIDRLLYRDATVQVAQLDAGTIHVEGSLNGTFYDTMHLCASDAIVSLPFTRFLKFTADADVKCALITVIVRK